MYLAESLYAFALFDYISMHSILKQDRRWNAEKPSATLDP